MNTINVTKNIIVIIGPTAVGKSQYAINLASKINAEIISSDAYQVYKGMDIGTAKIKDIKSIKHYLIDVVNPGEEYSVFRFLEDTKKIISNLHKMNKKVIICGGSGQFVRSFCFDYKFDHDKSISFVEINKKYEGISNNDLWNSLLNKNEKLAKLVHPNNRKRVLKYLERPNLLNYDYQKDIKQRDDIQIIGLNAPKEILFDRIEKRVDKMIKEGLIDEVQGLLDQGVDPDCLAFKAIGYKQVVDYLKNIISKEEMILLIKNKTKKLVKKQMTWFKEYQNVTWEEI